MMKTTVFQGIKINIENPSGSTRSGVDKDGKPWNTVMSHDYGEIVNTEGVDGDPVDVFLGPNKSAKWVYIIHQTTKDGTKFDEDKCFLGFDDAMDAKAAFYKNYDMPDQFYGNMSVVSLEDFKKKLKETKKSPTHIRASKIEAMIQLYAGSIVHNPYKIGDQVTVDGMHGRGIVVGVTKRRVTIKFLNREYISRDFVYVHSIRENTVSKMWRD